MNDCKTEVNEQSLKNSQGQWNTIYTVLCTCNRFGNITLIDDYDHKYISNPMVVLIPRSVIFIFIAVMGFFCIIFMIWGAILDSENSNKNRNNNNNKKQQIIQSQQKQDQQIDMKNPEKIEKLKKIDIQQQDQQEQQDQQQLQSSNINENNQGQREQKSSRKKSITSSQINNQNVIKPSQKNKENEENDDDIQEIKMDEIKNQKPALENNENQQQEQQQKENIANKKKIQKPNNEEKTFCDQYKNLNSFTSIFVIYKRFQPRFLRVIALFSRYYYNLVIAGYFARQEIDLLWGTIYVSIISCFSRGILGIILKVVDRIANYLVQKGYSCYWVTYFIGLGVMLAIFGYFFLIFMELLADIPEYNIQYWGLLYLIIFFFDLIILEIIVMYFDYSCQPPVQQKKVDIPINVYNNNPNNNQADQNGNRRNQKNKVQGQGQVIKQIQYVEITVNTESAPINDQIPKSSQDLGNNQKKKHKSSGNKHKKQQQQPQAQQQLPQLQQPTDVVKQKITPVLDWEKVTDTPSSQNGKNKENLSQF